MRLVVFFFSTGSQGTNVDNHYLTTRKERFVGQQAVLRMDSGTCLPDSDDYYRRLDLLLCDEEYIREVFSEIETSNCSNVHYNNTYLFSGCGTNHNGAVCTSTEDSIYSDQCHRSNNCSSECQAELHQLPDTAGCCIHQSYYERMDEL